MIHDTTTALGQHEARFLATVADELRDVPAPDRQPILELTTEHLSERPAAASWAALIDDLGTPQRYSRRLRDDRGIPPRVSRRARWRRRPAWQRCGAGLLALTLVAVGFGGWRWASDVPDLGGSHCYSPPTRDPAIPIEVTEAAGVSEARIGYRDGAEVAITLCLALSDPGVDVLDVAIPTAMHSLFQPTGVRMRPESGWGDTEPGQRHDYRPFEPSLADVDGVGWWFEVVGELTNCEWFSEGSGSGYDRAEVTYRYRHRTRTATVPLAVQHTFVSPADDECPRQRERG